MVKDLWRHPRVHDARSLQFELASCCVCGSIDAEPVAVGEDFEYRSSPDSFLAVRCACCSVVYLDPRPTQEMFDRIYPDTYYAFSFKKEKFGFVHTVRRRLEARRLLRVCEGLRDDARIVDVGCGDGFHLDLLRSFGSPGWRLEGVDLDERAVGAARNRGLEVHQGTVEELGLDAGAYDLAFMIQTIEHVANPKGVLRAVRTILAPGGRVTIVTDNTGSIDFRLFRRRHWGGFHFPRHWNLFDKRSIATLAAAAGFEVESVSTMVSPVNWVYSIRNTLDDWGAPRRVVDHFSLSTPVPLAAFTLIDGVLNAIGRGALLHAVLRRSR